MKKLVRIAQSAAIFAAGIVAAPAQSSVIYDITAGGQSANMANTLAVSLGVTATGFNGINGTDIQNTLNGLTSSDVLFLGRNDQL